MSLFIVLHPPSATIVQNYCLNWITNFPRARLRLFGNMMDQGSEGLPRYFIAQLRSWDCAFCRNVPPNVLKTLCSISQNHRGICDRIVLTEGVRIKCYFLSSDVSLALPIFYKEECEFLIARNLTMITRKGLRETGKNTAAKISKLLIKLTVRNRARNFRKLFSCIPSGAV